MARPEEVVKRIEQIGSAWLKPGRADASYPLKALPTTNMRFAGRSAMRRVR